MAVGTQQPQVLQPVVQSVAVDVVKGERQALSPPALQAAVLAAGLLQAGGKQALLEVVSTPVRVRDAELFDGSVSWTRLEVAALDGVVPGRRRQTEARQAISSRVPLVVEALNRLPVVAAGAALVDVQPETAGVVRNGGFGNPERACDVRTCHLPSQKLANRITRAPATDRLVDLHVVPRSSATVDGSAPDTTEVVTDGLRRKAELSGDLVGSEASADQVLYRLPCGRHEHMFPAGSDGKGGSILARCGPGGASYQWGLV